MDVKATMNVGVENMSDNVNSPSHYKSGGIETIDFIDAKQLGFYEGQVVKYITRWRLKHRKRAKQLEDLKKAQWYLNRLIEHEERK